MRQAQMGKVQGNDWARAGASKFGGIDCNIIIHSNRIMIMINISSHLNAYMKFDERKCLNIERLISS